MKKLFLIIGISTLVLSACSDDQNTDKQSTKTEHTQKDKKETAQKSKSKKRRNIKLQRKMVSLMLTGMFL